MSCEFLAVLLTSLGKAQQSGRTSRPTWTPIRRLRVAQNSSGIDRASDIEYGTPSVYLSQYFPREPNYSILFNESLLGLPHERSADVHCGIAVGSPAYLHLRCLCTDKPYRSYNDGNYLSRAGTRLESANCHISSCSPRWPSLWDAPCNAPAELVRQLHYSQRLTKEGGAASFHLSPLDWAAKLAPTLARSIRALARFRNA